jgi:hypothetical protein
MRNKKRIKLFGTCQDMPQSIVCLERVKRKELKVFNGWFVS